MADYPFTTLSPNLGVVELAGHRQFVMADVPGLTEGASQGKGLGIRFLRHLERTACLLHLVAFSDREPSDPVQDWKKLRAELRAHDPLLAERPEITALNKIDLPDARSRFPDLKARFASLGVPLYGVSAATGEGVGSLLQMLWEMTRPTDDTGPA